MSEEQKIYGVIAEFKIESSLIMEGKPMTYEEARQRMRSLESNCGVIRVAMFRITHVSGNESLIEKESE